jgi:hypothetical protein
MDQAMQNRENFHLHRLNDMMFCANNYKPTFDLNNTKDVVIAAQCGNWKKKRDDPQNSFSSVVGTINYHVSQLSKYKSTPDVNQKVKVELISGYDSFISDAKKKH